MSSVVPKDSIIEYFAKAANTGDFTLDITLNVNGSVISGTMISAKKYFEELSGKLEDGSEIAQKLSEDLSEASEAADSHDGGEANFIHMKNTRVYCGDNKPTPSKGKILWRGKIDQIDGFFLGRISESKNSNDNSKKS
ncbi:gas vesicle accessory protein GvpU [Pseudalkalibacillus salsuginis]|uniref:gas vesicle accessory protein GvpU n=1 Tax=Pseudalkalibacillus salsuginis TaxID=2910972 RepID=UPI001F43CD49|nr:gas vesicle accessory protein GvpU [Pseudalkalibacillus salsuginis]MCF6410793.1 gas vesicle protein GvpU [Pseudalkalibacillus salsuginis]